MREFESDKFTDSPENEIRADSASVCSLAAFLADKGAFPRNIIKMA
jgi:hypothetical protein